MTQKSSSALILKLHGLPLDKTHAPRLFQSGLRAAGFDEDPFLPRNLIRVDEAYDLSATARSTTDGEKEREIETHDGQVIVLEMPDGVTVVTSPQKFKEALKRVDPNAFDKEKEDVLILKDALQQRGSATRGIIADVAADGLEGLATRVFTLTIGAVADPIIEEAKRKACEWLGEKAEEKIQEYAELGVTWLGTKALMWAIEKRVGREPGLYRCNDDKPSGPFVPSDSRLEAEARQGALLIFIHGTGSSFAGSFTDLQNASNGDWRQFERQYADRIYAFEHFTLSESPIENALQLAKVLPEGARVHLVTHSRGGLVGDLLCLEKFDDLIAAYGSDPEDPEKSDKGKEKGGHQAPSGLKNAYAGQRDKLHELQVVLRDKRLRVERYVRVAAPARGTRLASGNFDVFLSGLLSLLNWVPAFQGNPLYSAFKRVVLEIAKNRTKPNLVPGIEAMLPESPMGRLLARAKAQDGLQLAVISGDVEGGGLLKRLGEFFTDFLIFDNCDNDFVVDTDSMYAGVARSDSTRFLFDKGPDVNHFNYFANAATRSALRDWLTAPNTETIQAFKVLDGVGIEPSREAEMESFKAKVRARGRDSAADTLPTVVVLPGVMGSHLWVNKHERVWFDANAIIDGDLADIMWSQDGKERVSEEKLFGWFYGDLCEHLLASHRVVPFPYDWRQPLNVLADRLADRLEGLLEETKAPERPIRVLAHCMGGLVVRATIHSYGELWDRLMSRHGARFVMLGTPNQGSHQMVETLLGKSDPVRRLAVFDAKHNLQEVLSIIGSFPGALQLLPKPGFEDDGKLQKPNYFEPQVWSDFKQGMRDFWFGDHVACEPTQQMLEAGRWLWRKDGNGRPRLPEKHASNVAYVYGSAPKTPCGVKKEGEQWKMVGTPRGDGSVTWASGQIDGIGRYFFMPATHGALASTHDYFDSLTELLEAGTGGRLMTSVPVTRGIEPTEVQAYDAGPTPYPSQTEVAGGLFGIARPVQAQARPRAVLSVKVKAMDLRAVTQPILVGHYEQDAISGAEEVIDREIVRGELSLRKQLTLYPGPVGSAAVVLLQRSDQDRLRGSFRGAIVAGLGKYDGSLTVADLTAAVRSAGLRYLLQLKDTQSAEGSDFEQGLRLSSLLLGYNSSVNFTIQDSVSALIRGVLEANRKFAEQTKSKLRISSLELVELYLDTAISATYAAQRLADAMNSDPRLGAQIKAPIGLDYGEGWRQRLEDSRMMSYWPRLMITDADRREDGCPPECLEPPCPLQCYDDPCECEEENGTGVGTARKTPAWLRRRAALADRLKFLYVGARARAETTVQQRQPGLIETLVEKQVSERNYQEDFSRSLFQLLIPHDFKEAVRQLDRIVFVLDGYTANIPWELMLADNEPLATRVAMVRQFASSRYRLRVNATMERNAYVIGNPSTSGFCKAFPDPRQKNDPVPLPAAEEEAKVVAGALIRSGFKVEAPIGVGEEGVSIINRLYKRPYRIIHIAAHGIYDERAADGRRRSGVVLSDGILITAAEIDAMETVPDLVFLNCCYLGMVDNKVADRQVAFNKLAYSVARELIEIGVRAVVAAGWAVGDQAGRFFAETFYNSLLYDNQPFGQAVFTARRTVWERFPNDITWGAFQAYGDPGWRFDPRHTRTRPGAPKKLVAPEELISALEEVRMDIRRMDETLTPQEARRKAKDIEKLLDHTDPHWLERPYVLAKVGDAYGDLGPTYFEKASEYYQRAIVPEDPWVQTPIAAIEQLANLEARAGEERGDPALPKRAIERLAGLKRITAGAGPGSSAPNKERSNILGSAYKRLAAIYADKMVRGEASFQKPFNEALEKAAEAYEANGSKFKAGKVTPEAVEPYSTLNWLFLGALMNSAEEHRQQVIVAQKCAAAANVAFERSPNFWNAIMAADAYLVETLLDGSFGSESGSLVLDRVKRVYDQARRGVQARPKDLDSVGRQILLMARFYAAIAIAEDAAPTAPLISERLTELANHLLPGASGRNRDTARAPVESASIAIAPSFSAGVESLASRGSEVPASPTPPEASDEAPRQRRRGRPRRRSSRSD